MTERVKIDRYRVKSVCRQRGTTMEKIGRELGFSQKYNFTRWLARRIDFDDKRFVRLAELLGVADRSTLLESDLIVAKNAVRALGPVFKRLKVAPPTVGEMPDEDVRAVAALGAEIARLEAQNDQRIVGAVDDVFAFFNDEDRRKRLSLLERKAAEIRTFGAKANDLRPYRISMKGLSLAADDLGIDLVTHLDMSEANILSFLQKGVRGKPDRVFICSTIPERTRRFEIAKFIGYKLMLKDPELQALVTEFNLPAPEPGRLNFGSDEDVATVMKRQQLAARLGAAILLPDEEFVEDVIKTGMDLRVLPRQYGTSTEVVARRVVALSGLSNPLPDIHMMKLDQAGNVIYKMGGYTTDVVRMPRRVGVCSKWAAVRAFRAPLDVTMQWSIFPTDPSLPRLSGRKFFCFAVVVNEDEGGYGQEGALYSIALGCPADEARKFVVYARRFRDDPVKVGTACTTCPRAECNMRAARNRNLEESHGNVRDDQFVFARKRRPWAPFTAGDVKLMRRVGAPR